MQTGCLGVRGVGNDGRQGPHGCLGLETRIQRCLSWMGDSRRDANSVGGRARGREASVWHVTGGVSGAQIDTVDKLALSTKFLSWGSWTLSAGAGCGGAGVLPVLPQQAGDEVHAERT
eukprot:3037779-Rhodomonas_salina.2